MARRPWHPSSTTRTQILDEAERQLVSHGYASLNIGAIAKALEMSPANIFKNFGSRAGLIDAIVLRWLVGVDESLDQHAAIVSASERLRVMLHSVLDRHMAYGERSPHAELLHGVGFEVPPSAVAFYGRLIARIERLVEDGIAAGEFAPTDAAKVAPVICDCMVSILDPAHVLRGRSLFSPEQLTTKCDQLVDFVISALRSGA